MGSPNIVLEKYIQFNQKSHSSSTVPQYTLRHFVVSFISKKHQLIGADMPANNQNSGDCSCRARSFLWFGNIYIYQILIGHFRRGVFQL